MEFDAIRVPKVSDSIVSQLEEMILDGVLRPGDRLPPERELALKLDVSRPSLREALVVLEARGLLQVRRGGGTFVADVIAHTVTDPLVHLLKSRPDASLDVLELRLALEEIAASYAAVRATDTDKAILTRRFEAIEAARNDGDPTREAEADVEFHMAVAEASHNVALIHVMRGLFNLLRISILDHVEAIVAEPGGREVLHAQHQRIFASVMSGDADAARTAAQTHLRFVAATVRERFETAARTERADRRLRNLLD